MLSVNGNTVTEDGLDRATGNSIRCAPVRTAICMF